MKDDWIAKERIAAGNCDALDGVLRMVGDVGFETSELGTNASRCLARICRQQDHLQERLLSEVERIFSSQVAAHLASTDLFIKERLIADLNVMISSDTLSYIQIMTDLLNMQQLEFNTHWSLDNFKMAMSGHQDYKCIPAVVYRHQNIFDSLKGLHNKIISHVSSA